MSCHSFRTRGSRPGLGTPREERIRVLVADGHALIRAALRALLEREREIAVVAEASHGEEAVALARQTRPDVVVMDIGMQGVDGGDALRRILADAGDHEVRVLILATFAHDGLVLDALTAGASGFIVKDTDPHELVRAVRVVADGQALLSPCVTRRLLAELAAQPRRGHTPPEDLDELTPREREVMALVAAGLTNADIAATLMMSPATAKTHVSRAMLKLGARDRAQLVALAYQTGLVVAGPRTSVLQPVAA